MSIDGGYTFPYVLAANTLNDGSENVLIPTSGSLPNVNTNLARIKVESVGNIFFDMSNANFSIQIPNAVGHIQISENDLQVFPNPAKEELGLTLNSNYTGAIKVTLHDCLGRTVYSMQMNKQEFLLQKMLDVSQLDKGTYFLEVEAKNAKICKPFVKI